jgi:hypothetical protein
MLLMAMWNGGLIARGELVEAGSPRRVLFEQADPALHGVALLVCDRAVPPLGLRCPDR